MQHRVPVREQRAYLCCAAEVTPPLVVGRSIKAGLQPVPASLAPVQACPRAVVHEPAHLSLHSRITVRAAIYQQQSHLYHLSNASVQLSLYSRTVVRIWMHYKQSCRMAIVHDPAHLCLHKSAMSGRTCRWRTYEPHTERCMPACGAQTLTLL